MSDNLLHFFQSINKGYIHPKGKKATDLLLDEMKPHSGEVILELGFGTGTSLVHTFSREPSIQLHGIEASEAMFNKASSRLSFCGLNDRIQLALLKKDGRIPFPSDFFDKIYVESVLAIQENDSLEKMIVELKRVLKPNGGLYINELIWNPSVPLDKMKAYNEFIKTNFGIIQANDLHPHLSHWLQLFRSHQFTLKKTIHLNNDLIQKVTKTPISIPLLRSNLFTFFGKIKRIVQTRKRSKWKHMKRQMNTTDSDIILDPYILVFTNKSD
jgi:ubiquinone/menaquinone biosynthesis C-methylase UbiE